MPNPVTGLAVGGSSILGAGIQSNSANKAARQQSAAAQMGIDEQRRQFDAIQELLRPYVRAGAPAVAGQQDLLGLSGQEAQQRAIQGIQQGPQFAALMQQGENAMLQNASATGGLRGGNLQGALAQFRPQLLGSLIDQQYSRLGGLAAAGQNAAANQGVAWQNMANQVSSLYGQQGAAQAGATMARGQAFANVLGLPAQFAGFMGGGGFGGGGAGQLPQGGLFGGMSPQIQPASAFGL